MPDSNTGAAGGGAIYALGIFGAWVWFWQQADAFWGRIPLIEANPFPRGLRCPGMRGTSHHRKTSAATSS